MSFKFKTIIIAVATFLVAGSVNAATVGLKPVDLGLISGVNEITVAPGDVFELELFISELDADLSSLSSLGLVGMAVGIKSGAPGVVFRDYVPNAGVAWQQTVTSAPDVYTILGQVPFTASPISLDHVIGTFTVQAIGPDPVVTISTGLANDSFPFNFSTNEWADFDPYVSFEDLTVNAVPVPSSLLLLGGGICALMGFRRRK